MYDKLIVQLVIASSFLFAAFGFFLIHFIIRYKNQQQHYRLERQRLLYELEKKELGLGFRERELILEEVSEDIHDNVGQIAYAIKRTLNSLEKRCTDPEQLKLVSFVTDLAGRIIHDTRHFGHSLNSDFIKKEGLCSMLEYEVERINASEQVAASLRINGPRRPISPEEQLLAYRIAQEAIHNTLQHASAENLNLQLFYEKESFSMRISDDGDGFDENVVKEKGTMGITNMHKRAKVLNGRLEVITAPGKGCNVTLYCPVSPGTVGML
ncbi:MAG TPA: ATP-binding protein [Candidatus Babeliaceae bacterium]|nr:ATP-binding protein [Candidatus Babeliaceae bacterium]